MASLSCLPWLPAGTKLSALYLAIPLAIVAYYMGFGPTWVFTLSLLGQALLAERVNFLTEQIVCFSTPTVGGFLNATFGNVPELMIAIFGLYDYQIDMVKRSLMGSIVLNLLLVHGASIHHGGIVKLRKIQKYNKTEANVNANMLLLALVCYFLPMLFRKIGASTIQIEDLSLPLSIAISITMLIVYFGQVVFKLRKANMQAFEAMKEKIVIGLWSGIVWLATMIALMTLLSKYVVETIKDTSEAWVLPVDLISITLLPIVSNAARYNGAITSAFNEGQLDISLSVALGSATQISTFVVPLCVTIAWLMGIKMDLNFNLLEIGFLTLTIGGITFPLKGFLLGRDKNGSLSCRSSCSFDLNFRGSLPY